MSRITQRISDLTNRTIAEGEQVVRLVVKHHPNFDEPITLEAKPEEVDLEQLPTRGQDYVALSIQVPGDSTMHSILMTPAEFNALFQQGERVDVLLERARDAERQEEQEMPLRRRVRAQRRQFVDLFARRRFLEAMENRPRKKPDASEDY